MENSQQKIFQSLAFKYPWRPYQLRVVDAFNDHISDQRLHIVAAPGAGKTTLGLEVFRKLQKPALALSPTRIIRDQWISRLSDFIAVDKPLDLQWVSNDLYAPKTFTSTTYQALHAKTAHKFTSIVDENEELETLEISLNKKEVDEFIALLKAHNIQVLILDEAHHLRSAWWDAISLVVDAIPNMVLLALTATPPYDANGHEWNKYEKLCGPIDEEISIPELVKANTLCPHQDYIWASDVSQSEKGKITDYDQRVRNLLNRLFDDYSFINIVQSHPWLIANEEDFKFAQDPAFALSLLVFLKAKHIKARRKLLKAKNISYNDIPELNRKWWQVLISGILFSNTHNDSNDAYVKALKKQLRASELLSKRELNIEGSRKISRSLSLSSSKIQSCLEIHKIEYAQRKTSLRQVVLTDYIRDENLLNKTIQIEENLGAWPIFRMLASYSPIFSEVALLTGRLSILHKNIIPLLKVFPEAQNLSFVESEILDDYFVVSGSINKLSNAFTKLLLSGDIKVLVGTRALLGEGWDAPVVNSLILASTVGSFMMTNQMRGRAIRLDKRIPEKTSSIWHLVAFDSQCHSGLADLIDLIKRFEIFVGLSANQAIIESGFSRMQASSLNSLIETTKLSPSIGKQAVINNNQNFVARFQDQHQLYTRWQEALTIEGDGRVRPSVKASKRHIVHSFQMKRTFAALIGQITAGAFAGMELGLQLLARKIAYLDIGLKVMIAGIVINLLYNYKRTFSLLKVLFLSLSSDGAAVQLGKVLCEALCITGELQTPYKRLKIKTYTDSQKAIFVSLSGGTFYESSLFANCMGELLGPIDNPRYIIMRNGKFMGFERKDYYS